MILTQFRWKTDSERNRRTDKSYCTNRGRYDGNRSSFSLSLCALLLWSQDLRSIKRRWRMSFLFTPHCFSYGREIEEINLRSTRICDCDKILCSPSRNPLGHDVIEFVSFSFNIFYINYYWLLFIYLFTKRNNREYNTSYNFLIFVF